MIIDITNEIYDRIKTELSDINVLQEYPDTTPVFPCIIISDTGCIADTETFDTSGEHYNISGINFDIFSNNKSRRTECKLIRLRIDNIISEYGMERTFDEEVPNYADTNIYRRQLKYTFKIDKTKTIYRR